MSTLELVKELHSLVLTNKAGCNDEAIKQILKAPKIVDVKDSYGRSPLKNLLNQWHDKGCNLDDFRKTALLLAEHGADCTVYDSYNNHNLLTHLVLANKAGCNDEAIKQILNTHKIVDAKDSYGRSALKNLLNHWHNKGCSLEDFRKTALLLAEHGADCTVSDSYDSHNLLTHLVLTNKASCNDEAIKQILKTHKIVNAKDSYGRSALKNLLNQWHNKACSGDDFRATAILLAELGANCRESGNDSLNLLHHLVFLNDNHQHDADIEKLLLLDKALPKHTSLYPYLYGGKQKFVEAFKRLVALGAPIDQGYLGESLLYLAVQFGHLELSHYLVEQGLSIDSVSNSGGTLLHSSSYNNNNEEYCNLLLSKNIDIDAQDKQGDTALHSAVSLCNRGMVDWLVKNNANVNIVNEQGETALDTAKRRGDLELVSCLLKAGAEINNSPKHQLLNALNTMKNYGLTLGRRGETKGDIVSSLADQLEKKAKALFKEKPTAEKLEAFKQEFIPLLHSHDKEMIVHRNEWAVIIANILIALTGLGALLIAGQLAYTKATTGKALLFFQQDKTNSEQLVDKVEHSLAALSVSS